MSKTFVLGGLMAIATTANASLVGPVMYASTGSVVENEWRAPSLSKTFNSGLAQGNYKGYLGSWQSDVHHDAEYANLAPTHSFADQSVKWNGGHFVAQSEMYLRWNHDWNGLDLSWPGLGSAFSVAGLVRDDLFGGGGTVTYRIKVQDFPDGYTYLTGRAGPSWDGTGFHESGAPGNYSVTVVSSLVPAFYQNGGSFYVDGHSYSRVSIPNSDSNGWNNYLTGQLEADVNSAWAPGSLGRHLKATFEMTIRPAGTAPTAPAPGALLSFAFGALRLRRKRKSTTAE